MIDGMTKLKKLEGLYRIHEDYLSSSESACHKGCATCCTRNVTITSLEGFYLLENLDEDKRAIALQRIQQQADKKRLIPLLTVNAMAQRCLNGEDLPEEEYDPSWTPCPLLDDDGACSVYAFRPLACRAMVSRNICGVSGEADMDDILFTVNNVFMQVLEHMDQGGTLANMMDLLMHLGVDGHWEHYKTHGTHPDPPASFLLNQPLSTLMVPPEHRAMIKPVIEELQEL